MEKQTTMKWYVVRAQNNREKGVCEKLIKEGEKGDLIGKIGRVLAPIEKSFFLKDGKKVVREKVLFPGYIFIECNAIGELKYFIKGLSGASGFLTNRAGDIQSLTKKEIEGMLGRQETSEEEVELDNRFIVGEEIRILDGPFATFEGIVEEVNGEKVKVSVLIFGRKTPVDLNINQIDKKI